MLPKDERKQLDTTSSTSKMSMMLSQDLAQRVADGQNPPDLSDASQLYVHTTLKNLDPATSPEQIDKAQKQQENKEADEKIAKIDNDIKKLEDKLAKVDKNNQTQTLRVEAPKPKPAADNKAESKDDEEKLDKKDEEKQALQNEIDKLEKEKNSLTKRQHSMPDDKQSNAYSQAALQNAVISGNKREEFKFEKNLKKIEDKLKKLKDKMDKLDKKSDKTDTSEDQNEEDLSKSTVKEVSQSTKDSKVDKADTAKEDKKEEKKADKKENKQEDKKEKDQNQTQKVTAKKPKPAADNKAESKDDEEKLDKKDEEKQALQNEIDKLKKEKDNLTKRKHSMPDEKQSNAYSQLALQNAVKSGNKREQYKFQKKLKKIKDKQDKLKDKMDKLDKKSDKTDTSEEQTEENLSKSAVKLVSQNPDSTKDSTVDQVYDKAGAVNNQQARFEQQADNGQLANFYQTMGTTKDDFDKLNAGEQQQLLNDSQRDLSQQISDKRQSIDNNPDYTDDQKQACHQQLDGLQDDVDIARNTLGDPTSKQAYDGAVDNKASVIHNDDNTSSNKYKSQSDPSAEINSVTPKNKSDNLNDRLSAKRI